MSIAREQKEENGLGLAHTMRSEGEASQFTYCHTHTLQRMRAHTQHEKTICLSFQKPAFTFFIVSLCKGLLHSDKYVTYITAEK